MYFVFFSALLYRYPSEDHDDVPFPGEVSSFGLPMGAVIESWPIPPAKNPNRPSAPAVTSPAALTDLKPTFNTFVLNVTSTDGVLTEKVYGACIIFYERFEREWLSQHQLDLLRESGARLPDPTTDPENNTNNDDQFNLHSNKCLLILSRNPLFDTYRTFLDFLLRNYTSKLAVGLSSSEFLPIER